MNKVVMPKIAVNLSSEQVEALSKMFPDLPIEEALLKIISNALSSGKPLKTDDKSMKTLIDTVNAYTGKIDEVNRKISHLIELIEDLVTRVQDLEEQVRSIPQAVQQVKQEEKRETRKSAIDILKEQKIMFESDIARKIKNRDAFFEKLRKSGAVVIELAKERVAVDREFFNEFVENVSKLEASSEEALGKELSKDEVKLLKALMNSGIAYFDSTKRKWVIDIDV